MLKDPVFQELTADSIENGVAYARTLHLSVSSITASQLHMLVVLCALLP